MRQFSIIGAITYIIFGERHIDITDVQSVVCAYPFKIEPAHTSPAVVYESHEPIVKCFDMSTEEIIISDEELDEYDSLEDDFNIHNIHTNQSLILYDKLHIDYREDRIYKLIYIASAKSKDIIYNINTTLAYYLNVQKFNDSYVHESSIRHVYYVHSREIVDNRVASVVLSMRESPVNILAVARDMLENIAPQYMSISEIHSELRKNLFTFEINDYAVRIRNADAVSVDIRRTLTQQRVCVMCVQISFASRDNDHGSIEYLGIHNGEYYVHNIGYKTDDYYPPILIHDDIFEVMHKSCDTQTKTTQNRDKLTQRVVLATQSAVRAQHENTTQNTALTTHSSENTNVFTQNTNTPHTSVYNDNGDISTIMQNTNVFTQNTNTPHIIMHNDNINISTILLLILLGSAGIMLSILLLYKPIKHFIRKQFGRIPLNISDNNENNIIREAESLV